MNAVRIITVLKRRKEWRKRNPHNSTSIKRAEYLDQIIVGNGSYGELNVESFANNHKVRIGNYVSIARNVTFVIDADHPVTNISTYPFKVKICGEEAEATSKGDIIVDDDVWIGYGSTILSGVHIHQGAVIAAGAVVTHDVPPYAIVGGVPAKVIKKRFSDDVIKVLLTIDYSKLTKELISSHIDDLYEPLDGLSAFEVEERINWTPRK